MPSGDKPHFTIIGAGLGGALLANYLARAGYPVEVYERRSDPRAAGFVGGRSINLAISERGLHALRGIGLEGEILRMAVPMRGRMIHPVRGDLKFQPYDADPRRCINSLSRGGLNVALLNAAERLGVRLHFDCRCTEVDIERGAARMQRVPPGETPVPPGETPVAPGETPVLPGGVPAARRETPVPPAEFWTDAGIIIGADGAYSAVRSSLQHHEGFDYSQQYLAHGYKELCIPPADGGGFRLEPHALHIWPRRAFMMIALPNPEGTFTCTCFWPLEGPDSFANLRTPEEIRRYFEEVFPDAAPLMPTLVEDYQRNPVGALVTIRCRPWHHRDKVVLLGDAAHAIVPFFGQGMNAAFEDCIWLDRCIRAHAPDFGRAFAEYSRLRKPHADAIADLALQNFVEMRDKTASRVFRMRKALERGLHRALPGWYTPLYTLVSFTNVPYADAVRRARRQDWIVLAVALLLAGVVVLELWLLLLTGPPS